MRFTDLGLAIPGLLLAAAIATILGRGVLSLVLGLAAVFWAPIARVTYGQAVVLREREYVEAARVQGAGSVGDPLAPRLPAPAPGRRRVRRALGRLGRPLRERARVPGSRHRGAGRVDRQPARVLPRLLPVASGLILFPAIFLFVLVASANLVGESLRVPDDTDR